MPDLRTENSPKHPVMSALCAIEIVNGEEANGGCDAEN